MKKNKILLSFIIVTFVLFIFSIIKPFPVPTDNFNTDGVTAHLKTGDVIRQEYYFNHDKVNSIIFREATYGDIIKNLDLTATLYDKNNKVVASKNYKLKNLPDGQFFELPVHKKNLKDLYILELKVNKVSDNDFVFYQAKDLNTISYYKLNKKIIDNANLSFIIAGYNAGYFWTYLILVLLIIFITIFLYKNDISIKFVDKLGFKMQMALYMLVSAILTISILYCVFEPYITIKRSLSLLLILCSSIYLIMYIIKKIKEKKLKAEKLFLLIAIPIGMMFTIYMNPYETVDVHAHYVSAYHPLTSNFLLTQSTYVPTVVANKKLTTIKSYKTFLNYTKEKYSYNDLIEYESIGGCYNFLNYLPTTAGVFIAKIINISPFWGMYLGKVFNYIFYLLIGYFIIKNMPFGKLLTLTYMLSPMFIQQCTSLNADAMILPFSLLFISLIFKNVYSEKKNIGKLDVILLTVSLLISSIQKVNYLVLGLLVFMMFDKLKKCKKSTWVTICICICVLLGLCGIWYLKPYLPKESTTSFDGIIGVIYTNKYIMSDLYKLFYIDTLTLKNLFSSFIDGSFGTSIGWGNYSISFVSNVLYIMTLGLSFITIDEVKIKYKKFDILLNYTVFIIGVLLVLYALLSGWTYIGILQVNGIQGRYFIPLNILLLLLLKRHNRINVPYDISKKLVLFLLLISNLYTIINYMLTCV